MPKLLRIFILLCGFCSPLHAQSLSAGDVIANTAKDTAAVHFTILTTAGYIGFTVPANWEVLNMQSKPPVAVAAFFVPVPGAKHSKPSNVAVSLISPDTEPGKAALALIGKPYETEVQSYSENGWNCFVQTAHQEKTLFKILDAKRAMADVVVTVRFAWPYDPKVQAHSGEAMTNLFNAVLKSVEGANGSYPSQPGDVLRRSQR